MGINFTCIKFQPLNLITKIAVLFLFLSTAYAKIAPAYANALTHNLLTTPTIKFAATMASKPYGSNNFTPATSNSTAAITFTSNNPAVATIVNNRVRITGVGEATITATQAANTQYEAATASATLNVVKGEPVISFIAGFSNPRAYSTTAFTPATATLQAPIIFTSDNAAVATIVNNQVKMMGAGTARIKATIVDNNNYTGTEVVMDLNVTKAVPALTFINNLSPRPFNTADFIPATATLGAPMMFSSDNAEVANILSGRVNMLKPGVTNITATIADDNRYVGTTLTTELIVEKATPVITFLSNLSPRRYSTTAFTPATATFGAPIVFTSDNSAVATIVNNQVRMRGEGTVNITATVAASEQYEEVVATAQLVVNKAIPAITFVNNLSPRVYTSTDFIAATATLGAPVTFTSDNPAVATIVNGQVNMVGQGTTNITATIADDQRYTGTSQTRELVVQRAAPAISFISNLSPRSYHSADFTPATATPAAPIVLTSDNAAVATVVNGQVNMVGPGTTTLTASVTDNNRFVGTQATATLTVLKAVPTITFVNNFSPRVYSATAFTPATATFGAPIVFTSDNPAVATIVNNQVRMMGAGTANITATITGSDQYEGTQVTMPLTVNKAQPTISFISGLDPRPFSTTDFVPATATSGAPVTFTTDNPSVATILNNQIRLVGVGTTTIMATIPDNERYVGTIATATLRVVQSSPTITFVTLNPRPFSTGDFTPATATFGAPVTFTSDNPAVATIVNNQINMVAVGTANITATVAANSNYVGTTSTALLNVVKSTPVITFAADFTPKRYSTIRFTPATANYGASLVFSSDNPAVAQIDNNQIRMVSTGTANITATVPDNEYYNGVSLTRLLTINKATQIITFAAITDKNYNSPPFTLSATSTSGLPVTYTSSDVNVATVSGNTVIITGIGPVTITALQPGNSNYAAANSIARTFNVNKVPQTINFAALVNKDYNDAPFILTGNTTSGLPITYTSSNPAVATIVGNTVTIIGAGTTNITASQEGNDSYAAAVPVMQPFTVNKIDQTLTFTPPTNKTYGDDSFLLTGSASSGLSVVYLSSDPAIAQIKGDSVIILGAGNVNITATQPGNSNYNAAQSITHPLNIGKATQSITFNALTDKVYADPDFQLTATSTSGLPITYSSSNPAVATISGNTVTITGVGTTTITASQPGNNNYFAAADKQQTLNVGKADQTITFAALPNKAYADPDFQLTATVNSNLPITYVSSNPAVATVTGNVVTIVGLGTTTITASQEGNENYNAATPVSQTLTVGKANQLITFEPIPNKAYNNAPFYLEAIASSGLPVSYVSSNPLVATVTGNTVTILGPGTTTITALQGGNGNYNAAPDVAQPLTVGKAPQVIAFNPLTNKTFGDEPFDPGATASSLLSVIYTSSNTDVATVSGNTITIVGAGTTTITASQPGNANYLAAADVSHALQVDKANQTITFDALANKTVSDPAFELTATATSGLPITYTSSNPAIATINGSTLTIVSAGAVLITATQPGNNNYNAAPAVSQILSIGKADQTITFDALANKAMGDEPFELTATASSGLAVVYTSLNTAVATVSGNVVTLVGVGSTVIVANQPGNASYNAAPTQFQYLDVVKGSQTISFATIPNKPVNSADFSVTASASSGLPLSFTSSDLSVATISASGVIHIVGEGTVTITASQAGNTNFYAATPFDRTFTVTPPVIPSKTDQTIVFAAIDNKVVGDPDFNITATASSGLGVTFTSSNDEVATVTPAGLVKIIGPGTVTITATQAGNETYNAATASNTFDVTTAPLVKQNQSITFNAISDKLTTDGSFTVNPTATSNLLVTLVSSNTDVATITGNTINIIGAGTVTITATQPGDATYNPANPVARTFNVNTPTTPGKLNQSITFAAISNKLTTDGTFNAGATASSGLTVLYSSSNTNVAEVSVTGDITIKGAGSVTITATQPGDATYNPADAIARTFNVNTPTIPTKQNQTITFAAISDKLTTDGTFNAGATASSGLTVLYSSSNTNVAEVSATGDITIKGAGSVTITATQPGDATYNPANPVAHTFNVNTPTTPGKLNQSITFAAISDKLTTDGTFNAGATASSGLTVLYSSSNTNVAEVSATGDITIKGAGSVTITATQPGNATYNPANPVARTFNVNTPTTPGKQNQSITFAAISDKLTTDGTFNAGATATSGLTVLYSSSNTNVAEVSANGDITIKGAGSVTITATQPGDATYNPANPVARTFNVNTPTTPGKQNQSITFTAISDKLTTDGTFNAGATATSGLTVLYSSSNTNVAEVSATGDITIKGAGSVTITATQPGDATYNPANPVARTFNVSTPTTPTKQNQSITFAAISNKLTTDGTFNAGATASSGLTVFYSSSNTNVAEVSATGDITIKGAGSVTITATQPGDATYNPANPVAHTFNVNTPTTPGKLNQSITFAAISDKLTTDGTFNAGATASSGLTVLYSSSNTNVAEVSATGDITIKGAGSVTITATQPGDATYNPADAIARTFNVNTPTTQGKLNQSITFAAISDKLTTDGTFNAGATATSGLTVLYSSSNTNVAEVSATGDITIKGVGSVTITASQPGDATYNPAVSVSRTFTVNTPTIPTKQNQTITFAAISDKLTTDGTFNAGATATSGLAVLYSSSNTNVAEVSANGDITIKGAGSVTITATQPGNATYNPANPVARTFNVNTPTTPGKLNQSITFAAISDKLTTDGTFNAGATATSGLAVLYSSSNTNVVEVSATGDITIKGAGSVTITATQPGNATYNPANPVARTFNVNTPTTPGKLNQSITFSAISDKLTTDGTFNAGATATSGLAVLYSSSNTNVAEVSATGDITIKGAGSVTITAIQPGDATYNPADAVSRTFTVNTPTIPTKQNQTITFAAISDKLTTDGIFNAGAAATSGLAVLYSSSNTNVAEVSATGDITIKGAGSVTITATQPGDATYNPASPVARTFNVNTPTTPGKLNQSITFAAISDKLTTDGTFNAGATASSGLTVLYSSSNTNVAEVSATGDITIKGAGSVTITAIQPGDATYNPANPVAHTFNVNTPTTPGKLNQSITFAAISDKLTTDGTFNAGASATSGLTVLYSSSNTNVAEVSANGDITIKGVGSVTITATQPGNTTYNAANPVAHTFNVTTPIVKQNQTITFNALVNKTVGDPDFTVSATTTSPLTVTFTSGTPSVATVTPEGLVKIISPGTATIIASQAGNATYNAATATQSFVVSPASVPTKLDQIITFNAIPSKTVGDPDFTVSATTTSPLTVTFTSGTPSVATVTLEGLVKIIGPGTATIIASQAGNATYNAATATQSFVVSPASVPTKLDQTITFNALANKTVGDPDFTVTATTTSPLTVTFTSGTPSVATVTSEGLVKIIGPGTATIIALQAGNATYNAAAPQSQSFVVNTQTLATKTNQTINGFAAISNKTLGDAPFTVSATATSNLPVTFTSSNSSVAMVSGNTVTIVGVGNVTITASQPGDATYNPAPEVSHAFTVNAAKAAQSINFAAITDKTYGNLPFTLGASATSGLNISYSSSNPAVATVSGNTVTIIGAGTTVITATQAGNNAFNTAVDVTQNLRVNQAPLNVSATNATRIYGTANPVFLMNYSGFVGTDSQASLTTQPTVTTTATPTSPVGQYALVPAGGVAANYSFNYTNATLTITQASASITFAPIPAKIYTDADFDAGATNIVGEPIVYTSSNTAVATIVNNRIHITGVGTAIIKASFAATSGYSAPAEEQLLVVNKASQSINFAAIPAITRGETYTLDNLTATSGLPVNLTVADQNIVTVQGFTLTARQLGATTVTATQPGNANFLPATAVLRSVEVINVNGRAEIEIHKAVSPNGDGINEFLLIEGITKFPGNKVTVYNRNGVKIWETNDYDNSSKRFEGRSNVNGQLQQAGTYFYVIQFMSGTQGRRIEGAFVLKYQ